VPGGKPCRHGTNPFAYDALVSPDRDWTSDPGVVFTFQVLLWIAVQDGWPVRMYAESLGQRWFDSNEARLLAESRQAREESYSFPPYCDPLFPTDTVCTPLREIRQEYITEAAEQLCLHDERKLRRAIDVLEFTECIELTDQRTDAGGEDFESIGDWFRLYSNEELCGISREWSQGSLRSTVNDARWNQLVVVTEKGHAVSGAMREAYANDVGRRNAARDAFLDYLYKGNHPILWDTGFEQDPRGFYMGQRFRPKDRRDAADYLLGKDLIQEIPTNTRLGDTVKITDRGIDYIEKHAGSVSSFLDTKEVRVRNIDNVGQAGVFISYVREDSDRIDVLQRTLEAVGIPVWRDVTHLWPGEDWRVKIRHAITKDSLVFIACFSNESNIRKTSYQREELLLAIDQLRLRRPDDPWFIPVRFDDCSLPDVDIGGGRGLASIQCVDLFGDRRDERIARLVTGVRRILGPPYDQGHTALQQTLIQASARRAEVWPRVESVESLAEIAGLGDRDWNLILANTGDAPARDVTVEFPDTDASQSLWKILDNGPRRKAHIDVLAPRGEARFHLHKDYGAPVQMNCVVSWSDERGTQENMATLRLV
jgi:hypothetical protein